MNKYKSGIGDRAYLIFVYALLIFAFIVTVYPLIYIVSASFSDPLAVSSGEVFLYPVRPTLIGYQAVFDNAEIWVGYRNSLMYASLGTALCVFMTIIAAYPLSRKHLYGRRVVMTIFTFTMFFSGGMIPGYILIRNLGMINKIWAMIIPGCVSVYFVILAKTYFQSNIPDELLEASQLDGCNDFMFLRSIVVPLSMPIIAVIGLYSFVGIWNSYFNAFLYLNNKELFPLQLVLRNILLLNQMTGFRRVGNAESLMRQQQIALLLKYSLIVVASLPVLAAYPFVQKYFVKGVMIGSIKA